MTKNNMGSPELSALLARLRWPVPAVKWWVTQQLALLLLNPHRQNEALEILLVALEESRFETEAVEALFVFWLAQGKEEAFPCPADLGQHVKARSPLSDAVLKSLLPGCTAFGEYLVPPTPLPGGPAEPTDFLAAEAHAFPLVLRSDLKYIEERTGLPLQLQFASEWRASQSRVPNHHHGIDHFLETPRDQYTGQFFTEQSARARSAFLRTLSLAGKHGLPAKPLETFALSTLPLDPVMAWLEPRPPVAGLKLGHAVRAEPAIESHVQDVLSAVNRAGLVGAISWIAVFKENVYFDCAAMLWEGPSLDWPNGRSLEDATEVFAGMVNGSGLERVATCVYGADGGLTEDAAGFRPRVGRVNPGRYGYMQAELVNRGIFAPIPADRNTPVVVIPTGDTLTYCRGNDALGQYGYWNISWAPSHLHSAGPRCGTYLILTDGGNGKHAFYAWHCRRLTCKWGDGGEKYADTYGLLPLETCRAP